MHLPVLDPQVHLQAGEAGVRAPLDALHQTEAEVQLCSCCVPLEILCLQLLHPLPLAPGQCHQGALLEVGQREGRACHHQQQGPEPAGTGWDLVLPV